MKRMLRTPPPPSQQSSAGISGEERITVDRSSDSSVLCKWTIQNFATTKKPMSSPYFELIGCLRCRVVLLSRTDSASRPSSLSLYLEVSDPRRTEFGSFIYHKISILNHLHESNSLSKDSFYRFTDNKMFHGWNDVALSSTVLDPRLGFIFDNSLTITADIRVLHEVTSFTLDINKSDSASTSLSYDSGKFTWALKNFGLFVELIKTHKLISPSFRAEDCNLRISVHLNVIDDVEYLSLFLDSEETEKSNSPKERRSCWCVFRMSVLNQRSGRRSIYRDLHGRFVPEKTLGERTSIGWINYMELSRLIEPDEGFLVDDTVMFSVSFQAIKETTGYLTKSALPYKPDAIEGGFFWAISNFTRLKDRLKKWKITGLAVRSPVFNIGNMYFRLVVYPRGKSQPPCHLSFYLEVMEGQDKSSDLSCYIYYQLSVLNQRDKDKSVKMDSRDRFSNATKEFGWCQFMTLNSLFNQDAGFLLDEAVIFLCQIRHHDPSAESTELSVLTLSNYLDEHPHSKYFEITSKNVDAISEIILRRKGINIDLSETNMVKHCLINASWMWSTISKLRNYIEPVKTKDLKSAVDNFVRNIDIEVELPSLTMKMWYQAMASQQVIIDLLLDIMVECCQHLETRSSVSSLDCYDTSSEHSAQSPKYKTLASRVDGSSSMCAVECLEEKRTDISEKAILAHPPSEAFATAILKINSIQDLKIKWHEQSEELLCMIINSLMLLEDTVPPGCSKPERGLVSVKKISHVLDKAPKQLQLDLVTLVPKLVDHSDHPVAASALIHQLTKPDADPELQVPVFSAISQLDLSSEVWEHVFFLTSKLVLKLNDGARATTIGFLFKASSPCQHISKAVKIVRGRLCDLGVEVSPCVLNFLSETVTSCSDIAKALLRDIDSCFELNDNDLATSGGTPLYGADEHRTTGLNMMDDQLLHENRHFSDVFTLIEMLSVPSLTSEASQAFERAVSQGYIVVPLVAMVLERRRALRLNIGPISFAGKNQQRDEAADEKIESSPVEEDDFTSILGLVESLSLSRDSRVHQFAQKFYAILFRLFADESYRKRMLKGLVDRAISLTENGHQADRDFNTLLFLVNEEWGLAGPIFDRVREVTMVANVDRATLRDQLRVSEDQNLRTQEERVAEHADMVREKASLLEMLSESEATTNHYKSELKLEKDRFAKENKDLSAQIQKNERQLEWFQSEKNDEITKLSAEKNLYKDRLHNLETQFSQLKSRNSDDLKRLEKEKNDLAERLKSAESAKKRSDDELKRYAREMQVQKNVTHSLQDEIGQLKVTVEQLEQEKLDKEGRIKQLETDINGMEANFIAWQRLEKEKNDLAERLESAESARKRSDDRLNCYARDIQVQKDVSHSLQDEIGQLKVTVEKLEQEKLNKEERIKQLETDINGMEANCNAWQQHPQSLINRAVAEEMSKHAPLYGVGLEDWSTKELEMLAHIHEQGLEKIHALQLRKDSVIVDPRANHSTLPNSSWSCSITPPSGSTGRSASVSGQSALFSLHGSPVHNCTITPPLGPTWQSDSVSLHGNRFPNRAITPPSRHYEQSASVSLHGGSVHNRAITPPARPTWQSASGSLHGSLAQNPDISPPSRLTRQSTSVSLRGNPVDNHRHVTFEGPPGHNQSKL